MNLQSKVDFQNRHLNILISNCKYINNINYLHSREVDNVNNVDKVEKRVAF